MGEGEFWRGEFANCTSRQVGPCKLQACSPLSGDAGVSSLMHFKAGEIMVTGGMSNLTMTPDAAHNFIYFSGGTGTLWNAGDTLSVNASGDPTGVPAWTASIQTPGHVILTNPWGNPFIINKSTGVTFTWTFMGGPGQVVVNLSSNPGASCSFPASAGTGTIPPSALTDIATGVNGTINALDINEETVTAGEFQITVSMQTWGNLQGGLLASGAFTVQ